MCVTKQEREQIFWEEVAAEAEDEPQTESNHIMLCGHLVEVIWRDSLLFPWSVWKFGIGEIASGDSYEDAVANAKTYLQQHETEIIQKVLAYWKASCGEDWFVKQYWKQVCPVCCKELEGGKLC